MTRDQAIQIICANWRDGNHQLRRAFETLADTKKEKPVTSHRALCELINKWTVDNDLHPNRPGDCFLYPASSIMQNVNNHCKAICELADTIITSQPLEPFDPDTL